MKPVILALFTLLFSHPVLAYSLNPEFVSVSKNQPSLFMLPQDLIIYETNNHYILKSPLTNFESYDYYFVQMPQNPDAENWFIENTQTVLHEPQEFIVAKIDNQNQLLEVANRAHEEGGFCGMIHKLFPSPIERNRRSAPLMTENTRAEVRTATQLVDQNNILQTMETMSSWPTRFQGDPNGVDTAEKLKNLYQSLIPIDRNDVEIELVSHQGTEQKSIVVRILGQSTPEKIVILGSHIDSTNPSDNTRAPGADDNASGTSTNMEVFRVLMEAHYMPQNTIEIHGYGAEEIGLVGSGEMAEDYKNTNKEVLSMVQFDMNGYAHGNPKITFVRNGTDWGLTQQLQRLVENYNEIPSTSGFLIFGSSDHAAWNRKGFPVAFPTEDPFNFNSHIHTNGDTMDKINSPTQIKEFGKLGVAYLMHFGG